jgi:hypothetical protein
VVVIILTESGQRSLGLNLFYTDDCPDSYEPQGFMRSVDEALYFPSNDRITRKSKKSSPFSAGAYRAKVAISHVDARDAQCALRVIPEIMDYPTKRSRLDEYKGPSQHSTTSFIDAPNSPPLPLPFYPPLLSSDIMASPAAPSSPTRDDIQTKEALQQMQRSSSRPQGLLPTQSLRDVDVEMAEGGVAGYSYEEDSDAGLGLGGGFGAGAGAGDSGDASGGSVVAAGPVQGRRKMSQSELVVFDLSSSGMEMEMEMEEDEDEDEDGIFN